MKEGSSSMSYTALYRKFRPQSFTDVKGQDHIVTTLKNQIKRDRIGHAYLFCGTRGTGKTTIAKIMAKAVNCEQPQEGNPCNECATCQAINRGNSLNVIEIDAASNNGVDNIRDIIEEVRYSPTEGKYKVYIIDEVHMLSAGAFNALLKTLEEPPSYVIFILATTEVHKIPITILSRCQRYDFKRITVDIIAERLKELMEVEQVSVEEKAIRYIARAADGALRDALSLIDQCIAFYYGQELTYDMVLEVLGAVDVETFTRLLSQILENRAMDAIGLLEEIIIAGRDITQFTVDFTWYLRNLLLVKVSEDSSDMIEVSSDNLVVLQDMAARVEAETLIRYIRIFSELANQIKYASQKRVMVEIALIKLCKPQMERNYDSVLNRLQLIEDRLEQGIVTVAASDSQPTGMKDSPKVVANTPEKRELEKAVPEELKTVAKNWGQIVTKIGTTMQLAATCLRSSKPYAGNDNQLILMFDSEVEKGLVEKEETLAEIEEKISQIIGKQIRVQTKLTHDNTQQEDNMVDLTKIIKNIEVEYED